MITYSSLYLIPDHWSLMCRFRCGRQTSRPQVETTSGSSWFVTYLQGFLRLRAHFLTNRLRRFDDGVFLENIPNPRNRCAIVSHQTLLHLTSLRLRRSLFYLESFLYFFCVYSADQDCLTTASEDSVEIIKYLEESRRYTYSKQFMTRAILEIVWLPHVLPLPLVAQLVSIHSERYYLKFLHEARNGDPRCFETFAKLPLADVRNQDVGLYVELDMADERDGPCPLFGSALAKRLGYYVIKIGDWVLCVGVGRKGEEELLELVRKNGWKVGKVMSSRKGDRPSRIGIGRRVAEHRAIDFSSPLFSSLLVVAIILFLVEYSERIQKASLKLSALSCLYL